MKNFRNNQKGYVISFVTFFVLIVALSIVLSMSSLIFYRQKISANSVASTQSYYAAEAGIEDALLKLKNSPQASIPVYNITMNGAAANVAVSNVSIGGSRIVTSTGTKQAGSSNITRTITVVYGVDTYNVNFYYGIAVGSGGLSMQNGSEIKGNVFSNGNISGSGTIDNNVIVSGNGNSLQGVYVGGNAMVYSCLPNASVNNLTYVTGGVHTCTIRGTSSAQSNEISQQPMPISQSQIDQWKSNASATLCSSSDVSKLADQSNKTAITMGNCKVAGDLIFANKQTLTLTGNIYVTGNILFGNTDTVGLVSNYIGGGFVVADGTINTGNGNTFSGSGQAGSYLMFLSTSTSSSAIILSNNSAGAVFYTSAGTIQLLNNISAVEVAGYAIAMSSNSTIQYSSGVENIYFSNGPGGSWKVMSWQEQ